MADVLSLPDAERLAERLREAIPRAWGCNNLTHRDLLLARVESDLAGLRDALDGLVRHRDVEGWCNADGYETPCQDADRYEQQADRCSDGLRATALMYGIT